MNLSRICLLFFIVCMAANPKNLISKNFVCKAVTLGYDGVRQSSIAVLGFGYCNEISRSGKTEAVVNKQFTMRRDDTVVVPMVRFFRNVNSRDEKKAYVAKFLVQEGNLLKPKFIYVSENRLRNYEVIHLLI